jgi:hypothetical protein
LSQSCDCIVDAALIVQFGIYFLSLSRIKPASIMRPSEP